MKHLELVVWRDAHFDIDHEGTRKDYLMQTVGWTKKKGQWLRIVGERGPKGTKRAVTHVPLANIVSRRALH